MSSPAAPGTTWEYLTAPVLIHNTQAILNNFGRDGWELVTVTSGACPANSSWPGSSARSNRDLPQRTARRARHRPAPVAPPAGSYVPARRSGSLVFTAGQVPFVDGSLAAGGKVGAAISAEEAKGLAGICALNALAAVDALVGIDAVVGVVKVVVFVASAPGFGGQPGVANGASDLLAQIFGEAGKHARSAVGVAELPLDSPVEVELIVEVSA